MRPFSFLLALILLTSLSCNKKVGVHGGNPTGDSANLVLDGPTAFHYWLHEPLHPGTSKPVTFSTRITDSTGIKKVELFVKEYELYRGEQNLPAKRKRVGGTWGKIQEWNFSDRPVEKELSYKFGPGFPAASNIMYVFRVTNAKNERTDRMAQFDAGKSPWPKDKIMLYSTNIRPLSENINLCFLPDRDYRNDRQKFLRDTRELITEGFHKNNMIGYDGIDKWQYFYTNQPVNGKLLVENYGEASYFPDFLLENKIEGIDAFGLLHQTDFTDRALPVESVWFLANNFFTAESHNFGTAVHEAAHTIFKLSDEYEDCVCFEVNSSTGNVFSQRRDCENASPGAMPCRPVQTSRGETWYTYEDKPTFNSKAECESYNRRKGISNVECIGWFENGKQYFLSEPATCVMWDDGDRQVRDFMPACASVVARFYDQLERGNFVDSPAASDRSTISYGERQANIFGYERVVRLECTNNDVEWNVRVDAVKYGVPNKNFISGRDVNLAVKDKSGATTYELSVDYPDYVYFHAGGVADSLRQLGGGQMFLNVPYDPTIANIAVDRKIKYKPSGMQSYVTEERQEFFNIEAQLQRAVEASEAKE